MNLVRAEKESFARRQQLLQGTVADIEQELGRAGSLEDEGGARAGRKRNTQTPYMRRLQQSQSDQQLTKVTESARACSYYRS